MLLTLTDQARSKSELVAENALVRKPLIILRLYWLLRSSVQKQARRDGEKSPSPACQQRRVGVPSDVVTSILMLERRYSQMMEKLLVWLVF